MYRSENLNSHKVTEDITSSYCQRHIVNWTELRTKAKFIVKFTPGLHIYATDLHAQK